MPSEQSVQSGRDQYLQEPLQPAQSKVCSSCQRPLSADSTNAFLLHDAQDSADISLLCGPCRTRSLIIRTDTTVSSVASEGSLFDEVQRQILRTVVSLQGGENEAAERHRSLDSHRSSQDGSSLDEDMDSEPSPVRTSAPALPSASHPQSSAYISSSSHRPPLTKSSSTPLPSRLSLLNTSPRTNSRHLVTSPRHSSPPALHSSASGVSHQYENRSTSPDPLADITRLRVRSQGHHCLYPGATFQGTQKSGRNSYDVIVTIVNADFASSHLCGYLRIRGLTDDWPELTTYFDAEIIGSRYGFLTRNWGANEQEDMVHWARFPAFRHVRHELKKPHLTMKDADRGAVFMRWKEKFLVPDHRVQDINGASFAGFYYVCVDFNPQNSQAAHSSLDVDSQGDPMLKPDVSPRIRRGSSARGSRPSARSSSRGPTPTVATMSGFYFHQNSEPYQQLSLVHVPEHTSSCFEFR